MTVDLTGLPLEQKVGQLFFIGIPGPELDERTLSLVRDIQPGGICLFARNIREASQTRDLLHGLRAELGYEPFLSIDQEGGLVDRLRRIMTPMPAANKMRNAADAAKLGGIIGESLRMLGFNMDFAPVVDVIDTERAKHTNGLFSREFGRSKEDVVELAGRFVNELQAAGIVGCLKHFPGLGGARVDSHEDLPLVEIDQAEFENIDLFPYTKLLKKARAVMIAHAAFPALSLQERDQNGTLLPSSLSKGFVTTLLRDRLGFDGIVITDDLEMGAILKNYGIADACTMAIGAGADMLAICADEGRIREGHAAVLATAESGGISEDRLNESLRRIAALRQELSPAVDLDPARLAQLSDEVSEFASDLDHN
jgi:beta-N-acetylhexosaminidase